MRNRQGRRVLTTGGFLGYFGELGNGRGCISGGEGGIRTLGTHKGTTVFETVPIDRSGTSPDRRTYRQHDHPSQHAAEPGKATARRRIRTAARGEGDSG